jgi:hypothetical protein
MQMSEVHDYASRLLREHGDKAQLIAAQRVLECEKRGYRGEAEDWRRNAKGNARTARQLISASLQAAITPIQCSRVPFGRAPRQL